MYVCNGQTIKLCLHLVKNLGIKAYGGVEG
jgi:hypothetical protein